MAYRLRRSILTLLFVGALLILGGCGGTASLPLADGRPVIITSVAPLTDIVRNVGGDQIALYGLIPDGVDSHTFEPPPSDARLLADADLVILNGLDLETPILKMASANMRPSARLLMLGEQTIQPEEWLFDFRFPADGGSPNPHLWLDVQYAAHYAELVRDALVEVDPDHWAYYEANAERYLEVLDQLDRAIATAVESIPAERRKLLTYHDSWPYFAKRYGLTVVGAVQPADFAEPSAREVAALIGQLRAERVPAVFGSEVFPSKVLQQIAREAGVAYVDSLRDDELPGVVGGPDHTYVGMMLANLRAMVPALGGSVDGLTGIDPRAVYSAP